MRARTGANALEGRALAEVVALHEDPFRALGHGASRECPFELVDLLLETLALGGRRDEGWVVAIDDGEHRAARDLGELVDEVERVLCVAVQDGDGDVRVFGGDALDGFADLDGVPDDLVAERVQDLLGRGERLAVLVGDEHRKWLAAAGC